MKTFSMIMKILAAMATVAGVVYIIAAYGEKIVAFARRLLGRDYEFFCDCEGCEDCDCFESEDELDDAVEETIVAGESDFEG